MSQYSGGSPRKKNMSKPPEWRLEQIEYHIRQALRQDNELCSMFGLLETELTALLKRARTMTRDYLYVLEEQRQSIVDQRKVYWSMNESEEWTAEN